MSKKHKKQVTLQVTNIDVTKNELPVIDVQVTSQVTQNGTQKAVNRFRKIDMKLIRESIKFIFFNGNLLLPLIGSEKQVNFIDGIKLFIGFLLSSITFDTSKIYVCSRQHFLNMICNLLKVTPSMSKRSNAKENKTVTMYGNVKDFGISFDVDKFYSKFIPYDSYIDNGINVLISKYDVVFMHHEIFDTFKSNEILNDTECIIVELTIDSITNFLIDVENQKIEHEKTFVPSIDIDVKTIDVK